MEPVKLHENRRFSFNSYGKAKSFFKISSANSEKKEKAENFHESSNDLSLEKNLHHDEISYSENIDEINCANNNKNNNDCFGKEAKSSVNKIFTTTVIEKNKKAAINFKVIKNRDRFNSTNTVNSLNFNSNHSNNNSNYNTACNTNVNNNPLSSISYPFLNIAGTAANNENCFNNVVGSINNNINNVNEICCNNKNNFSSENNLNKYINSNSTSSNSVVVNNLNSITNLNINSNINLLTNNKINFNNNSINTHNSNSNSNQLNNKMDEELNEYNIDNNSDNTRKKQSSNSNPTANTNHINSIHLEKKNTKEILNSSSENKNSNALIENHNNYNFNINNNLNNPNMKNSKNNMNDGKQQVFDLKSQGTQNSYTNTQSNYNYMVKNIQNPTQASNGSNMNQQMQFFGNANHHQEFFNDTNPQAQNANGNLSNQNIRNYAQQNYSPYQQQNLSFYEKENLAAAAAAQNFNTFYPSAAAENFSSKKRNKENEESLNFNSMYINSANYGNGVALRQQPHNMYPNHMQQSYLNSYNQFNSNVSYGNPGINSVFPGNAVVIGMSGIASPGRKPLRCKENYIDELLCNFNNLDILLFVF